MRDRHHHKLLCKAASCLTQENLHMPHCDWQNIDKFFDVADLHEEWSTSSVMRQGEVTYAEIEKALTVFKKASDRVEEQEDMESLTTIFCERVPWLLRRRALSDVEARAYGSIAARMLASVANHESSEMQQSLLHIVHARASTDTPLSQAVSRSNNISQVSSHIAAHAEMDATMTQVTRVLESSWQQRNTWRMIDVMPSLEEKEALRYCVDIVLQQVRERRLF